MALGRKLKKSCIKCSTSDTFTRSYSTLHPFHAQRLSHTDAFTHRRVYTQTLLHTDAFPHRRLHAQTLLHTNDAFTHRRFYTQTLLHTDAFTHRRLDTQTLLHTNAFTHRHFAHRRFCTRRFYTQTLLHTQTRSWHLKSLGDHPIFEIPSVTGGNSFQVVRCGAVLTGRIWDGYTQSNHQTLAATQAWNNLGEWKHVTAVLLL